MACTSIIQAALCLMLALGVSSLDPKYKTEDFLTAREHGLDISNIFHMQQCLLTSGNPSLQGSQSAIDQLYSDVYDWYMKIAGECVVEGELCQQVHCAYNLRTCQHPSFTSLEFIEAIINASDEVCMLYCQQPTAVTTTTTTTDSSACSAAVRHV